MFKALNGPAKHYIIASLGTATPLEIKDGANPAFSDRKVITLQPNDKIYVYFADEGETPNAATVSTNGFEQPKKAIHTYEASNAQSVWILSVSGTIDVKVAERG